MLVSGVQQSDSVDFLKYFSLGEKSKVSHTYWYVALYEYRDRINSFFLGKYV